MTVNLERGLHFAICRTGPHVILNKIADPFPAVIHRHVAVRMSLDRLNDNDISRQGIAGDRIKTGGDQAHPVVLCGIMVHEPNPDGFDGLSSLLSTVARFDFVRHDAFVRKRMLTQINNRPVHVPLHNHSPLLSPKDSYELQVPLYDVGVPGAAHGQ